MVGTGEVESNIDDEGLPLIIGYAGLKPVYMHDDLRRLLRQLKKEIK